MNETTLEKDLGVHIDPELNFEEHFTIRVSLFPVKPFPEKRESRQSISREIPGKREI